MSRSFFAWVFMLLMSFAVILSVYRIDFLNRMFLQGVNPFERAMK
ncbi:hypothetical protein ES703_59924 [subsurface metagenome]